LGEDKNLGGERGWRSIQGHHWGGNAKLKVPIKGKREEDAKKE